MLFSLYVRLKVQHTRGYQGTLQKVFMLGVNLALSVSKGTQAGVPKVAFLSLFLVKCQVTACIDRTWNYQTNKGWNVLLLCRWGDSEVNTGRSFQKSTSAAHTATGDVMS